MSPLDYIEKRTYDEINVGDSATLIRTLKPQDIQLFAIMSGDVNPHVDPEYAKSSMFREVIAHGMWGGALISTVLGTQFPGPGTIYIDQTRRQRESPRRLLRHRAPDGQRQAQQGGLTQVEVPFLQEWTPTAEFGMMPLVDIERHGNGNDRAGTRESGGSTRRLGEAA